ncbi:T9SS type A sorting domain-containing protein, partial [bacterium]|nr:T9SS type A sorting domain-containing protein [bacterium]
EDATEQTIVGSCGVPGCIDASACNYNVDATFDDGSCTFAVEGLDCDSNCLVANTTPTSINVQEISVNWGSTYTLVGYGGDWSLVDASTDTPVDGVGLNNTSTDDVLLCLADGCYEISGFSGSGSSYAFAYSINGAPLVTAGAGGAVGTDFISIGEAGCVTGCTDELATNYDANAHITDNTLCEYALVQGCMDVTACNYDSTAEVDFGCEYAEEGYDCDGLCLEDADADGICDADEVLGCTDPTATNYDASATDDDDSCIPCEDISIELSMFDAFGDGWNGATFSMTDGTNTITSDGITEYSGFASEYLCVPAGCYEVTVGGGLTDYEVSFTLGDVIEDAQAGTYSNISVGGDGVVAYCDIVLGCTDSTATNFDATATSDDGNCCYTDVDQDGICDDDEVLGCTDSNADNFNPNAGLDDGSCTFCGDFTAVILATSDATVYGGSDGNVQATGAGGSSNYDVNVFDADGVPQNPFVLSAGNYVVQVTDITSSCISELEFTISQPAGANPCDVVPSGLYVDNVIHNRITFNWASTDAAPSHYMIRYRVLGSSTWTVITAGPINTNAFNGTSRTRYFMEPGTTYEWSIRARVLNEDLSINCQSDWSANSEYTTLPACANLENLSVSAEATWVTFFADAPSEDWGVWQSKGKIREVGTNSYRYAIGGSDGNINALKGNFTASTEYEWHTKAWCTGNVNENGNSDPMYHSGWGDFSGFSTEDLCDKMPMNLTTSSNGANTAVIMSWDTPQSGEPDHYFLEMTNVTTGAVYEWNDIPGSATSQTKFNQNPGDEISWRIRGACGSNGTSWATIFSQPVTYTLGGERVAAELVSGLDVYPNPSRDIFNITFTSEEAQTMSVKVVNMIGEEIYNEELIDFVGQYTKVIDMNTQPKGVYFLEITTSTGGINKKIVLQ